jgi:hypothetical protein
LPGKGIAGARSASFDSAYFEKEGGVMAPLDPSNTHRYKFEYTVNGASHDFQLRSTESPAALGTLMDEFLTALGPKLYALTIGQVTHAVPTSNIFNPVVTGIEGNVYGSGGGVITNVPFYYDFIARSSGGRRLRLAIFGATNLGLNYRLTALEDTDVDAALAVLVGAGGDLKCIDNFEPIWKPYVNVGVNVHWQKAIRA